MNETIISLHHIRFINKQIYKYLELLSANNYDTTINVCIKNTIIILTCSFLDEWNNYLIPKNANFDKLKTAKKKCKPAIKRINKWSDIEKFRNSVLAHNFRDNKKDNKSIFLTDKFDKLNIPIHISEFILLSQCIDIATSNVASPFINEIENTENIIFEDKGNSITKIDFKKEFNEILVQINQS